MMAERIYVAEYAAKFLVLATDGRLVGFPRPSACGW
jgi:hypothetical protein